MFTVEISTAAVYYSCSYFARILRNICLSVCGKIRMRTENTVRNEKRGMISHMRTKKRSIAGIAILVYFLIAVLVVIILKFPDADKITDDSGDVAAVEQGTELLDRYDSQDTTAVENEVRSVRAAIAQRAALAASSRGESAEAADLTSAFAEAVVMGDSQAEAFEAYQVLPSQSVAATIGRSIVTAEDDYQKTVGRNPRQVFITYGMNDCLIYNGDVQKFIDAYSDLISRLQNDIPGVQIYICSIIVPSDAAIAKKPALTGVTAYNAALQQLAVQLNLVYVDASSLIRPDLYAPDGLHMSKSFYQSWAYYMASCAGRI